MDQDPDERIRTLLEKGRLAAAATDSLITTPATSKPHVAETATPASRFEIADLLGSGSMGQVYRAYDRELQRTVALKFLRPENAALMSQFLREARAQARVEHENIAKVYDVGEWDGKTYIAMKYVPGKPLGIAAPEMTLEQKVLVMIHVAEAVHAAHCTGFIHRDLKPGNVLVEATPDGWKPYVVDFGLAREDNAAGATTTGMIVGSPAYMAPEQARGEIRHLDRRTDVYGLGATLFEVLAGRPPFEAASGTQVLVQVLQQEPPLLRTLDPSIPADLEAITAKCLEKEPQRRYESALALAQDMRRYAAGDEVKARRTHWRYRAARRFRKNIPLSIALTSALVVSLVLVSLWARERWRSGAQARLAQSYTQQAERLQAFLRYSYMLPLHDLSREKAIVRNALADMERGLNEGDGLASGPGHSAIGRTLFQLQEYEPARKHLELADLQDPETSLALGQTLGALYQQGLQEAARLSGKDREDRKRELETNLRNPAIQLLQRVRSHNPESAHYLQGLIEFYDGKYQQALDQTRQAIRNTPWLYEAVKLQGDIYLMSGIEHRKKEFYPEALSDYSRAGEAYQRALQMARSDPGVHLANCERAIQELEVTYYRERTFPEGYKSILNVCDQVLLADPVNAEASYKRSRIFYRLGDYAYGHGLPFFEHYQHAIAAGEKALALNPSNASYFQFITMPLGRLAWYKWEHGIDPQPELMKMIQLSEKAKDYSQVALGHLLQAEMEMDTGRDPRRSLDQAAREFERTLESLPDTLEIYNFRGAVLHARAQYESLHGRSPIQLLDQAISNYEQVGKGWPNYPVPWRHLAEAYLARAEYERAAGHDPTSYLELSAKNLKRALALDPYYASALLLLGRVHLERALYEAHSGVSPVSSLQAAEESLLSALKIRPDDASTHRWLARVYLSRAAYDASKKLRVDLHGVEKALKMAEDNNPNHYELHVLKAKYCLMKASQENAGKWKKEAASELQLAVQQNPSHPEVLAMMKEVE